MIRFIETLFLQLSTQSRVQAVVLWRFLKEIDLSLPAVNLACFRKGGAFGLTIEGSRVCTLKVLDLYKLHYNRPGQVSHVGEGIAKGVRVSAVQPIH